MSAQTGCIASVKKSLRITSTVLDTDLQEIIDACKLDLAVGGVGTVDESDKLTLQAIKFYCRANFQNGDVNERNLYNARYEQLKASLALCSNYAEDDADDA